MQQLELNVYRSMLANLPRIADNLEKIANNTTPQPQIDFEMFEVDKGGYEKYKESNPDAYLSEEMYGFVACLFAMFKQYGAKGVSTYLLTHDRRREIQNALDTNSGQVSWCIDDFEGHAEHIENEHHDGKQVYDRDKFQYALDRMINKHDANIGITWETIHIYLDEYCIINEGGE